MLNGTHFCFRPKIDKIDRIAEKIKKQILQLLALNLPFSYQGESAVIYMRKLIQVMTFHNFIALGVDSWMCYLLHALSKI